MEVRQLFDPGSSTYSYLLWDPDSRDAVLIDPVQDQITRDIRLIRKHGLKLRYTMETHVHADHITGSGLLRRAMNSLVMVHENSRSKCADILLKNGDLIPIGAMKIRVLHTPGHTDSDVCYLIAGMAFTGNALLIRSCGRTDFYSSDAGTLYDSITERLFSLPDDTIIYPGHDYEGRSCSTVGEEKAYNPRVGNGMSRDQFIAIMQNLQPEPPLRIHVTLPSNVRCGF
jgi:glyoxylase-like metal-dependent hydrolase (beta-lactamase superfamily II)